MKPKKKLSNLQSLLPFFTPYKKEIFYAAIALAVTALMVLFFGEALKYLIDYGFAKKDQKFLNIILISFFIAVIILAIAGYFRSYIVNSVAEKVIANLRSKIYNHIINVSAQYFEIHKTGDVISRLTVDTVVLYNIISSNISFFLRNLILFFGGIIFLFLTNIKLSMISIALIPIAISPIIIMGGSIKFLSLRLQEAIADMGSHIEETINGVKTVQSFSCEKKESDNFLNYATKTLKISITKIRKKSLLIAVVIAMSFSAVGVVLWFGGMMVINNNMSSGDLSSFIFYSIIISTSLVSMSQISGQLQTASAAARRIFDIIEVESPVKENTKNIQKFNQKITINFQDVNFSYPSVKDKLIINNFNLEIKPNDKISIVGISGCGKSTLLQLLLRFYDISNGKISLNNIDIRDLSFESLRQNFSYIAQDPFIFSGTIYENIIYGSHETSKDIINKLIDDTPTLSFIKSMPEGIDSYVGEKGIKLSGGEKQRIAIARAIINKAPILLLDEATSSLDNENEALVLETLSKMAENKTIITVAHKLSAIIKSNKIIYINNGQIAEIGTHDELIKLKGLYRKMYDVEISH
ncbi:ABC transporter ATP-binding protein/permease [Rickettsiales bacterium]|nr:ABC transporter ATP-binding protein/permease [Rickettsiales bacterium]